MASAPEIDFEAEGLLDEIDGDAREARLTLLRELAADGASLSFSGSPGGGFDRNSPTAHSTEARAGPATKCCAGDRAAQPNQRSAGSCPCGAFA